MLPHWRFSVILGTLLAQASVAQAQSDFTMPDDVDQPVIVLDYQGGFRAVLPGQEPTPLLVVFANGTVLAGPNGPNHVGSAWTMPQDDLSRFFDELVERYKVFSLDGKEIQRQIDLQGERLEIADAPTTHIRVRAIDRDHRIELYASQFQAHRYSTIESLQQFVALEQRLRWLAGIAHLGGVEAAQSLVEQANQYLVENGVESPRLKVDNLASGVKLKDGSRTAIWRIEFDSSKLGQRQRLSVTCNHTEGSMTCSHLLQVIHP